MKYWVFDLDDTLVDTNNCLPSSLQRALAPFGIEVDELEFDHLRRSTPLVYFASKVGKSKAEAAYQNYLMELETSLVLIEPFPVIKTCLEQLHGSGKSLALWTGRDRNSAEKILAAHKMLHLFKVHCYGCDSFQQKPNSQGYCFILRSLGAAPEEAVMVGDHEYDLIGPAELGSLTVHARWSRSVRDLSFQATQSFRQIDSFYQWLEVSALVR